MSNPTPCISPSSQDAKLTAAGSIWPWAAPVILIWAGVAAVGTIHYWRALKVWPDGQWLAKLERFGQFGDAFNVATSLASVLTLVVAVKVLHLQRSELHATKKALEDQHKELAHNRDEARINDAISDYRSQLAGIVVPEKDQDGNVVDRWSGRDGLFHLWKVFVQASLRSVRKSLLREPSPTNGGVTTVDLLSPSSALYGPPEPSGAVQPPSWIA